MKRWMRISLNLLLPPLLALVPINIFFGGLWIWDELFSRSADLNSGIRILGFLVLELIYSYALAILPSLLFALLMECVYTRGNGPKSAKALRYSSIGGAGAGTLIAAVLFSIGGIPGPQAKEIIWFALAFIGIGTATGLLVGLVLRAVQRRLTRA